MQCVNFIFFFTPLVSVKLVYYSAREILRFPVLLYLLLHTLKYRRQSLSFSFFFEDRTKKLGEKVKIRRRLWNTYNKKTIIMTSIFLNNNFILNNYLFDYLIQLLTIEITSWFYYSYMQLFQISLITSSTRNNTTESLRFVISTISCPPLYVSKQQTMR